MAFSMFVRNVSSKMNGCPSRILSQQLLKCSTPIMSPVALRALSSIQPVSNNLLNKHQLQTVVPQMKYASASPAAPKENKVSLWIAERIVAASLIVTVPLAIAMPCKVLDIVVAVSLTAHIYWGFEALVQEYVRTILFGTLAPKVAHIFIILMMMLSLGGLFYLIFDDIGLGATVRKFWSIKSKRE